jgi:TolB-like protein
MHASRRIPSHPTATRPREIIAILALALTAVMATSCATRTLSTSHSPGAPLPPPGASLAVVPFENLSHHRNAGLILTDLATTLVYAQKRFNVIEVSQVANDETRFRHLDVSPWERQLGVNTAAAAQVGAALKAEWVLAGSVGEYGFVDGFGETAAVGVTLRLVRVEDGAVSWAGSLSRRAACGAFSEESVHRLGHEVLDELLQAMIEDLKRPNTASRDSAS